MEVGYRVHLANTAAILQYRGLKYSDDDSDAAWLAKLLRLGLLPEGYIHPKCYYQHKRAKTNGVLAIKTVAHKLARACYHILRDGTDFEVKQAFA